MARAHRLRKKEGGIYHASLVEAGDYLRRCLCYIELNMVQCGVVSHPREWEWVGYHEILGSKRHNRVLDLEQLCCRIGTRSVEEARRNLEISLADRIARNELKREAIWTESVAVGSRAFLEPIEPGEVSQRQIEVVQAADKVWALQAPSAPYGREKEPGKRSMSPNVRCFFAQTNLIDRPRTALPLTCSTNQKVVWKTPTHELGWSSPVIWGTQVWVTSATEDGKQLFAMALVRETGHIIHDIKVFNNDR